jgi:hypothetical protein
MLRSRLACAIAGEPLLQRTNSCSRRPASSTPEVTAWPVFGECRRCVIMFPVQDLDKNMLDEDEARL